MSRDRALASDLVRANYSLFIPNDFRPIEKSTKYSIVFKLNSTYFHNTRILTPMDALGSRLWSREYLTRRFTKYYSQYTISTSR